MNAETFQQAMYQLMKMDRVEHFLSLITDNGSEVSILSLLEEIVDYLQVFFTQRLYRLGKRDKRTS